MGDNTQSWQQQFSSYAEYANWYHHYYGQPSPATGSVPPTAAAGVPTHATLAHPDVATATAAATAAVAPPTPYYPAYVAPQPHQHTPYAPPQTAVPPPVAGL